MGQIGEVNNPPERPEIPEVLRLYDLHASNITDEAALDIAMDHLSLIPDKDNVLFHDDPALWRAFAILEQLRIIPNPRELNQYRKTLGPSSDEIDDIFEALVKIDGIRDMANDIASDLTTAYLRAISDDEKSIELLKQNADRLLEKHAHTNIVRVLNAIQRLDQLNSEQLILLRQTLGSIL